MKLPESAHHGRSWRIHELTPDFQLQDVWALPTPGGPHDLALLVRGFAEKDLSASSSAATRLLWAIRLKLGALLGWDGPRTGPGPGAPTLRDRLPSDLREHTPTVELGPFRPLYLLDDEFAAEIANETVHGVLHLGWVPDGEGAYRGQMAVLVKPNGLLGRAYMAAISPFRHLIVYPALMRDVDRAWQERPGPARTARVGSAAALTNRP